MQVYDQCMTLNLAAKKPTDCTREAIVACETSSLRPNCTPGTDCSCDVRIHTEICVKYLGLSRPRCYLSAFQAKHGKVEDTEAYSNSDVNVGQ